MSAPVDLLFEGFGRGLSALASAADPDLPDLLRECEGRRLALMVRGTDRVLEAEVRGGAVRILPPWRPSANEGAAGAAAREEAPPPAADAGKPPGDGESAAPGGARAPNQAREAGEAASGGELVVRPGDPPAGADLVLAGSVPEYLRFLGAIRRGPLPEEPFGRLEVHGSAGARAEFVELLRRIDPDYEALLARAVGGVAAHAMSRTTLGRLLQARRTAARLVDDLAEYLEEEARLVPDPPARNRFAAGVQALIDKVAELEERLDRAG